jgi:hypothetical protein
MKADRRHELQTNSLALWFTLKLPEIWQQYGSHILVGLILAVAAFWVIRWRMQAPIIAREQASQLLSQVEGDLEAAANYRISVASLSNNPTIIGEAINLSEDKDIRALAYILLGEYHWLSVNMPNGLSTSRPTSSLIAESYQRAETAFTTAIKSGTEQPQYLARAYFGRAKVAEQRAFDQALAGAATRPVENPLWAQAKADYEAVVNNPNIFQPIRDQAQDRIRLLEMMQQPVWIVEEAPTTRPTTEPAASTTQPSTLISDSPTSNPEP